MFVVGFVVVLSW
jgi:hypothetical protein